MTVFLTLDQIVAIHDLIEPHHPVISRDNLLSAVGRPSATYEGAYLHQSVYLQAAALLDGLLQAHGFEEGNKRTAWVATVLFLELNQVTMRYIPQNVVADFVVDVANHQYAFNDIAMWLAANDEDNVRPIA